MNVIVNDVKDLTKDQKKFRRDTFHRLSKLSVTIGFF